MNIIESIEYFENDIARSTAKVEAYKFLVPIFEGLEFPKGINMWVTYFENDGTHWVEFSAGHTEGAEQNLQPFIHAMCKRFSVDFTKAKNWNESALDYIASFNFNGYAFRVKVENVVPKSCRVEEIIENLSDEEIEQARQDALNNVQTTRVIRKIVCTDED